MILIRPQIEGDRERLAPYGFIPERAAVSAIVEVDGVPRIGAFARKTTEIYMVKDPALTGGRKTLGLFLAAHRELHEAVVRNGFTDAHCWTNDERFGKLLMHLSWKKALWPCYFLEDKTNG